MPLRVRRAAFLTQPRTLRLFCKMLIEPQENHNNTVTTQRNFVVLRDELKHFGRDRLILDGYAYLNGRIPHGSPASPKKLVF